jgi:hypothetical protein
MASYVETWKGIAFAVGRSERWCRYMAQRAQDPLPVVKWGGIVRVYRDEMERWMSRQQVRPDRRNPRYRAQAPRLELIA